MNWDPLTPTGWEARGEEEAGPLAHDGTQKHVCVRGLLYLAVHTTAKKPYFIAGLLFTVPKHRRYQSSKPTTPKYEYIRLDRFLATSRMIRY